MKFLIYAIGLAIVSLIIKSLQTLKKKGFETTSSILVHGKPAASKPQNQET